MIDQLLKLRGSGYPVMCRQIRLPPHPHRVEVGKSECPAQFIRHRRFHIPDSLRGIVLTDFDCTMNGWQAIEFQHCIRRGSFLQLLDKLLRFGRFARACQR